MTQQEQVIARLKRGWTTALEALQECGCMRLAARIEELRRDGVPIVDKWVESNGKKYKAYRIAEVEL